MDPLTCYIFLDGSRQTKNGNPKSALFVTNNKLWQLILANRLNQSLSQYRAWYFFPTLQQDWPLITNFCLSICKSLDIQRIWLESKFFFIFKWLTNVWGYNFKFYKVGIHEKKLKVVNIQNNNSLTFYFLSKFTDMQI
jgi:hypothetical protein